MSSPRVSRWFWKTGQITGWCHRRGGQPIHWGDYWFPETWHQGHRWPNCGIFCTSGWNVGPGTVSDFHDWSIGGANNSHQWTHKEKQVVTFELTLSKREVQNKPSSFIFEEWLLPIFAALHRLSIKRWQPTGLFWTWKSGMSPTFISAWQAQIGNQSRYLGMPREQLCCSQRWSPKSWRHNLRWSSGCQLFKPNAAKIFDEYAIKIFLPYVQGQLQHASRAYVVWDQYREGSLKSQTRERRVSVKGRRRHQSSRKLATVFADRCQQSSCLPSW